MSALRPRWADLWPWPGGLATKDWPEFAGQSFVAKFIYFTAPEGDYQECALKYRLLSLWKEVIAGNLRPEDIGTSPVDPFRRKGDL